jgi:hypothetical protein
MSETLTLPARPATSTPPGAAASPAPGAAGMPLERLEAQICELAGHLAAATCRFLTLVGDFDARNGWQSWDLPSCSAWLAWKCQLAPGTAREHVRVARALRDLPVIHGEFAAGRLSYCKVRALTRIATPATDADLAELAGPMTGGQLERFVRAHRRAAAADDTAARAARRVTWRLDDDGSLAMTVRLPPAEGAVLLQALRAQQETARGDSAHDDSARTDPTRADSADGDSADGDSADGDSADGGVPADLSNRRW